MKKRNTEEIEIISNFNRFYKWAEEGKTELSLWEEAHKKTTEPYFDNKISKISGDLTNAFERMNPLLKKIAKSLGLDGDSGESESSAKDSKSKKSKKRISEKKMGVLKRKIKKAVEAGIESGGFTKDNIDVQKIVSHVQAKEEKRKKAFLARREHFIKEASFLRQKLMMIKQAEESGRSSSEERAQRRAVTKQVTKGLREIGEQVVKKYIPKLAPSWIGTFFSFILAFKELVSAFAAYKKLVERAEKFGLKWNQTLFAEKLREKFELNKQDPEKTGDIGLVCHTSLLFIRDGVEAALNSVDFAQDLFFSVIESFGIVSVLFGPQALAAVEGVLVVINMGVSGFISLLDYITQNYASASHDKLLNDITGYIEDKISELKAE